MTPDEKPRGPGRPKLYKPVKEGKGGLHGAPYLGLRLDPPVYSHIKNQPEGPRAYVQRLVTEDMDRRGGEEKSWNQTSDSVSRQKEKE